MSLATYWPTKKNITECIRTEAEELTESVLLSVHEKMNLVKKISGENSQVFSVTENDLLLEVLKTERPIPIIANSGMGKSHLIRWLHAKLKTHKTVIDENWHMIRIPKNASLRQVLGILLDGLKGDVFEQARKRIHEVGSSLKEDELADLFVLFMAHRIKDIADEAKKEQRTLAGEMQSQGFSNNDIKDSKAFKNLNHKISFSKQLPNLVSDLAFKKQLLKPGSSVHQIATRWTKGATDEEIEINEYGITENVFEQIIRDLEVDDLSLPARNVIANLRLDSDNSQMKKAVEVINEALSKASQTAFQQLFQFNSGNFQDLFKEIRKYLKQQNRTLLILVEDLAAISAIEDVLIDSLLEEKKDDLCILRSVIAVTDGYSGYIRRQGTLSTRSNGEWNINAKENDSNNVRKRIISFCARYLNAARYGQEVLSKLIDTYDRTVKLEPFETELLSDEEQLQLNAFGHSHEKIPLFPFNENSINTLIDWNCVDQKGDIFFNPRVVLNNILLHILRDFKGAYESGVFPSGVPLIYKKAVLEGEILRLGIDSEQKQAIVLSNIWGSGDNFTSVKSSLNVHIAKAFNMPKFAGKLEDISVEDSSEPEIPDTPDSVETTPTIKPKSKLDEEVDLWINHDTKLSSGTANKLRKALYEIICNYSKSDWLGFKKDACFGKKHNENIYKYIFMVGSRVSIGLPFSDGNPSVIVTKLCDEKTFFEKEQDSFFFQRASLAILRYSDKKSWNYAGGLEDYVYYHQFQERWVPRQLKLMRNEVLKELPFAIEKQKRIAVALGVKLPTKPSELLPVLLQTSSHIQESLAPAINPSYTEFREELLNDWDKNKPLWLSQISTVNNAVDFYEFGVANKAAKNINNELLTSVQIRLKNSVIKSIKPELNLIHEMLSDCSTQVEFESALESMKSIYRRVAEASFLHSDSVARKTFNSYVKIVQESVKLEQVKNAIKLTTETDEIEQLQLLGKVDGRMLQNTFKLLQSWKVMSTYSMKQLDNANERTSAHQVEALNNKIAQTLSEYENIVMSTQLGDE